MASSRPTIILSCSSFCSTTVALPSETDSAVREKFIFFDVVAAADFLLPPPFEEFALFCVFEFDFDELLLLLVFAEEHPDPEQEPLVLEPFEEEVFVEPEADDAADDVLVVVFDAPLDEPFALPFADLGPFVLPGFFDFFLFLLLLILLTVFDYADLDRQKVWITIAKDIWSCILYQ